MRDEDTLIMPPRLDDFFVRAAVRAGLVLVLVVGAFAGAAIFALGILVGVTL